MGVVVIPISLFSSGGRLPGGLFPLKKPRPQRLHSVFWYVKFRGKCKRSLRRSY